MNKEIICPNCSQRIKILDTIGYDLYLENLKKEEIEIERLNNIINEFEDWLNAKYEEMHDIWYVKVLNKLQELKGDVKSEKNL